MKRKIFIFGIMLLILSPLKAYAADQISMVCDKTTAKPGDQVSCDIKFSNEKKNLIQAVSGSVTLSDNLEFVSAVASNGFFAQGGETTDKNIGWINEVGTSDANFTLGKVTFKIKSDAKSGEATVELTDAEVGIKKVIKLLAGVKAILKNSAESKKEVRTQIEPRSRGSIRRIIQMV